MIWTGKKVYDPITNSWSSGYWIKDEKGNWYPVWQDKTIFLKGVSEN